MSKPVSNAQSAKVRPPRTKSAARLASEANTRQQLAVRTNAPRPNDRQSGDLKGGDIDNIRRRGR
jgi:hypothetical protein